MDKWDDVSQITTDGQRIVDEQSGEVLIMRKFDYAYHPNIQVRPKKSELLTKEYVKWLEDRLWGDALELIPPFKGFSNPRVVIQKKGFTILAVCKPKKGNIIPYEVLAQVDKPLTERLIEREPQ